MTLVWVSPSGANGGLVRNVRASALLLLGLLTCVARPVRAQSSPESSSSTVQRCVSDHENARLLRLKKEWLPAREAMARCAEASCPLTLRTDCRSWSEELTRALPTVLILVERDDDGEQPATLTLDGRARELPSRPEPIELLPGAHQLRVALSGYPDFVVELEFAEGEKNRVVRARFTRSRPGPPPASRAAVAVLPTAATTNKPIPASTWWLSGAALVTFAGSGLVLGSALYSRDQARESCAPACPSSERRSIESRLFIADILAGAGVVLAGSALYTYLTRPTVVSEVRLSLPQVGWNGRGMELSLQGQF